MATIRVFLLTCHRPKLLPRALASLCAQTFQDWICELHNDAPEDDSPRQLLAKIADSRITLHQHASNWGAIAAFNHAFAGGSEPFASILEDDNWWDPEFLATAYSALKASPNANVAWCNLRLWQEKSDGSWADTGKTTWSIRGNPSDPRIFYWPQPLQMIDALHSQGAMLYRARFSAIATVPPSTPLAMIEPTRERLMPGGWLLLPQPLAHFALTLQTARSADRADWARAQLLVAASYLKNVPTTAETLAKIWATLRAQTPPSTVLLFHTALAGVRPFAILRHASLRDWLRFLAGAVRHPLTLFRVLRFRQAQPALWKLLLEAAGNRTREGALFPSSSQQPAIFCKTLF